MWARRAAAVPPLSGTHIAASRQDLLWARKADWSVVQGGGMWPCADERPCKSWEHAAPLLTPYNSLFMGRRRLERGRRRAAGSQPAESGAAAAAAAAQPLPRSSRTLSAHSHCAKCFTESHARQQVGQALAAATGQWPGARDRRTQRRPLGGERERSRTSKGVAKQASGKSAARYTGKLGWPGAP